MKARWFLFDVLRESHPHGFIERLEEGLFHGFISNLTPYRRANRFDVESWVSLLKGAKAYPRPQAPASGLDRKLSNSSAVANDGCAPSLVTDIAA